MTVKPDAVPRRVAIADAIDLLQPGIDLLRAAHVEVTVPPVPALPAFGSGAGGAGPGPGRAELVAWAAGSPVLVVGLLHLGAPELHRLAVSGTRLIIRAGIGFDIIDVPAATEAGITVANVPDYCVNEVADHTLLLLLAAQRQHPRLSTLWRSGWQVADRLPGVDRVDGSTLGIVGLGRIGQAVARRAAGFGWRVIAYDPYASAGAFARCDARRVDLDGLFRTAQAITLHCPLAPATVALVNADRLKLVQTGTVLVNTSRGGLVDLDAVDDAVRDGRLGAVALDVLDEEPDPPLDHPLLRRPEVTITPHVAWYSTQAREELALKTAEEALRWLDHGRVRHPVNRVAP